MKKQQCKIDLVSKVAKKLSLTKKEVLSIFDLLMESIEDAAAASGRVELRGFGVFRVSVLSARAKRNPKTGELVNLPEKRVVRFRSGSRFDEKLIVSEANRK